MARAADMPLDSYKKYENGTRVPGGEALLALAGAGVDIHALLGASPLPQSARVEQPRAGYVYLPLDDIAAAAGGGRIPPDRVDVPNELAFKEDWIRHVLRASPDDLRLAHVEGDSMVPDLNPSDIFLYNRRETTAAREGIYFLRMEDALLVKQLQRLPGGVIRVISRNPAYSPFEIDVAKLNEPESFAIIGRVVWHCRRL